ncbi:MAG TPA: serine hydrolase domain-containing protein [Lacipirellula sp.]
MAASTRVAILTVASTLWYIASSSLPALAAEYNGLIEVGDTGKQIVELVRSANRDAGFSGAVLAGRNGKVIAAVAVGESGGKPLEVTTLFEIGSCTKPFTAVAVMKLVEQGKLALDDSIADHLPGVPENCRAITVRHLLQHTSGIPGTNYQGSGTKLAAVLPLFLDGGPRTKPGERHEYWNQGYALLSEVIARASGKSYTAYVRDEIFKPCKMQSSCFTGDRLPKGAVASIGVSTTGRNRGALEHPYGEYGFQYRGMGGLVTNLVDLWRFDRTLAAEKLLTTESIAEMTRPGPEGYALGWRVTRLDSGRTVHYHSGSVRGFLASIRRDPEDDGCLVVLANSDASAPFDLVQSQCEAVMEGREASVELPKQLDPKLIEELAGVYRDEKGRTMTVSREGGLTRALIDWHGPKTHGYLSATDTDQLSFDMMKSASPLTFERANLIEVERDGGAGISALTIVELSLRFERVDEQAAK